jgi:hypothetical protein
MPYIDNDSRLDFEGALMAFAAIVEGAPVSEGEMNFLITSLLLKWIEQRGVRYQNINAAVGVLECCKLELYRRLAAPYEDKKVAENGDVYECETLRAKIADLVDEIEETQDAVSRLKREVM